LFRCIRSYTLAATYQGHDNPMEAILLSIALDQEKRLDAVEEALRQVGVLHALAVMDLRSHALVDSLYVRRKGATRQDYIALAREITERTRLPLAVKAVYRYVVFFPSRRFPGVPVPNHFFAVNQDGGVKVRGLELRRQDTPRSLRECSSGLSKSWPKPTTMMAIAGSWMKPARYCGATKKASKTAR
jgi:hypothetical protein